MPDESSVSLRRNVVKNSTGSSYPFRIAHANAGPSTSPVKRGKTRRNVMASGGHRVQNSRRRTLPLQPEASSYTQDSAFTPLEEGSFSEPEIAEQADFILDPDIVMFNPDMDRSNHAQLQEPEIGNSVDEFVVEGDADEAYCDAVERNVVAFLPIGGSLYVVQGWSAKKKEGTVSIPPSLNFLDD